MKIKLEIACNHLLSCVHAAEGGADRIELFENLPEGGCTPSFGMIKKVKEKITLPIYVMIRPRGGDFCYSSDEFDIMMHDVEQCVHLNVDGIVFGILKENGTVDIERCKELQRVWNHQPITFHRAIDRSADCMQAAQVICDMGFERILTSGAHKDVLAGRANIKAMQAQFGQSICIMPGAGITVENIRDIVDYCDVREVHATAKQEVESSVGSRNEMFKDKISWSDEQLIQQMVQQLQSSRK